MCNEEPPYLAGLSDRSANSMLLRTHFFPPLMQFDLGMALGLGTGIGKGSSMGSSGKLVGRRKSKSWSPCPCFDGDDHVDNTIL